METSIPAGWYPDGAGWTRYWDGQVWTTMASPTDVTLSPPTSPAPPTVTAPARPARPSGWRRWNRRILVGALICVIVGTALTAFAKATGGADFTANGTLTLTDTDGLGIHSGGSTCSGAGGYSDIEAGAQVVIADAGGKTLALGLLAGGESDTATSCIFTLTVKGVPGGRKYYGVEVTHRGFVQYSAAQLKAGVGLTLGS